jgi:DNA-binding transcriptional ArsR family regulator
MFDTKHSTSLLDAMANPQRLTMLRILADREISVGELATRIGLSQSALSQHLAKLREKKLVKTRRDAQTIYYFCDNPGVLKVLSVLEELHPVATQLRHVG